MCNGSELGVAAVKCGIETRHLGHAGEALPRRQHTGQVVRLVQRRQGLQAGNGRDHGFVDQHRPIKRRAAVHDAVADRRDRALTDAREHLVQRLRMRGPASGAAQALDLTGLDGCGQIAIGREQSELDR